MQTEQNRSSFYTNLLAGPVEKFSIPKPKSIELDYREISPNQARFILRNCNHHNRKPSKVMITKYSTDMTQGNWQETGETISFDINGALTNGQHRLYASINTNYVLKSPVVFGLKPEAFKNIDNGKIRSNADVLSILKYKDTNILASLIRLIIAYEKGAVIAENLKGFNQITKNQIVEYIEDHPEIEEYIERYKSNSVVSSSIAAFCYWLFGNIDKKKAENYLDKIFMAKNLHENTIEYYMFGKLQRNRNAIQNKLTKMAIISNVILGWRRVTGISKSKSLQIIWDIRKGIPKPQ